MTRRRDNAIDIIKGVGILAVVIGHSGCPATLRTVIYMVHMPLFFLASGYLLQEERLHDTGRFVRGKIKSLYVPFLKYALPVLFFHNLLIKAGIMSTEYGAEYYDLGTTLQELVLRALFLEVHGEALLGTYWFLQALFFGYVLPAFAYSVIAKMRMRSPGAKAFGLLLFSALLISVVHHLFPSIRTVCLYHICLGGSFIWIGHMIRQKAHARWQLFVAHLAFISIFFLHPASMREKSDMWDCISILISGTCGFLLLLRASHAIDRAKPSILMATSRLFSYLEGSPFTL